jgi:transposase-like protein
MQRQVHDDIADIFAAPDSELADMRLKYYVQKYAELAPDLSEWMEENLPEGLTIFELPAKHRRRMRTTNPLERLHEGSQSFINTIFFPSGCFLTVISIFVPCKMYHVFINYTFCRAELQYT